MQTPLVEYLCLARTPPWLPVDVVITLVVAFALLDITMKLENVSNDKGFTELRPYFWLAGFKHWR